MVLPGWLWLITPQHFIFTLWLVGGFLLSLNRARLAVSSLYAKLSKPAAGCCFISTDTSESEHLTSWETKDFTKYQTFPKGLHK